MMTQCVVLIFIFGLILSSQVCVCVCMRQYNACLEWPEILIHPKQVKFFILINEHLSLNMNLWNNFSYQLFLFMDE